MPTDGGHLILSPEERRELLELEPGAEKFVRRYMSGGDFLNGVERYCLWLVDAQPQELRALPRVMARVEAARQSRLASKAASTRDYTTHPTLFRQIAQPESDYLAIPGVSSERRPYLPMAYLPNATLLHSGVLQSSMHMAWMRTVCGRLKSDYSYSNTIVYNNYPWPEDPSDQQREAIEAAARAVLDARGQFPGATLADLYDPLTMPPLLLRAHQALDRAVDAAYGRRDFASEAERVAFLFDLYQRCTAQSPAAPGTGQARSA